VVRKTEKEVAMKPRKVVVSITLILALLGVLFELWACPYPGQKEWAEAYLPSVWV